MARNDLGLSPIRYGNTWVADGDHPIVLSREIRGSLQLVSGNANDRLTDISGARVDEGMLAYVRNGYTETDGTTVRENDTYYVYRLLSTDPTIRTDPGGEYPNNIGNWSKLSIAMEAADGNVFLEVDSDSVNPDSDGVYELQYTSTGGFRIVRAVDNDNTLRIAAEELARARADSELGARIDSEEVARIAADIALGLRIDSEGTIRGNADIALGLRIDSEMAARVAADSDLNTRLAVEEAARISADSDLGARIDSEITDRITGDSDLGLRIDAEEAARITADSDLSARIDSEVTNRIVGDSDLNTRLTTEVSDRTTGDANLGARIDTEETARITADSDLSTRIDSEEAARIAGDRALGRRIDSETTAREAEDTALGGRITAEANTRSNADTLLGQRITVEGATRLAADEALGRRIDSETTAREALNNGLDARITLIRDSEGGATTAARLRTLDLPRGLPTDDQVLVYVAADSELQWAARDNVTADVVQGHFVNGDVELSIMNHDSDSEDEIQLNLRQRFPENPVTAQGSSIRIPVITVNNQGLVSEITESDIDLTIEPESITFDGVTFNRYTDSEARAAVSRDISDDVLSNSPLIFEEDNSDRRLVRFRDSDRNEQTIRSFTFNPDEFTITLASFTPLLSVFPNIGTDTSTIRTLNWDVPVDGFRVRVDNPEDFTTRFIRNVDSDVIQRSGVVTTSLGNYVASPAVRLNTRESEWDQTFSVDSDAFIRPFTGTATSFTTDIASLELNFDDETGTLYTGNTDTNSNTVATYRWNNPTLDISADGLPSTLFLDSVNTGRARVDVSNIDGSRAASSVSSTVATINADDRSFTGDNNNIGVTFSAPFSKDSTANRAVNVSTIFTRPDTVTGETYNVTGTDSTNFVAPRFTYPIYYIFTETNTERLVNTDFISGRAFRTTAARGSVSAPIRLVADYQSGGFPDNTITISSNFIYFWLAWRATNTQIPTVSIGSPNFEIPQPPELTLTLDLEPTDNSVSAESYNLYRWRVANGNNVVVE